MNIFFLDETGFQVSIRLYYEWSSERKRTFKFVKQVKTYNFNVIAIITKDCLFFYKILENTCKAEKIVSYFNTLVGYLVASNIVNPL